MFSHWKSEYSAQNEKVNENRENATRSQQPIWFKNKYHVSQAGYFESEYSNSFGHRGDNPNDKFHSKCQLGDIKLYSDNFELGKGTTKTTDKIPGYQG
jgi:hypothetical protein